MAGIDPAQSGGYISPQSTSTEAQTFSAAMQEDPSTIQQQLDEIAPTSQIASQGISEAANYSTNPQVSSLVQNLQNEQQQFSSSSTSGGEKHKLSEEMKGQFNQLAQITGDSSFTNDANELGTREGLQDALHVQSQSGTSGIDPTANGLFDAGGANSAYIGDSSIDPGNANDLGILGQDSMLGLAAGNDGSNPYGPASSAA